MYGIDFDFLPRSFLLVEKSCFSQPGPLPLLSSPLPCFAFLPPSCVSSFSVPFSARKENRELLCLAVLPLICRCLPLAFECAKVSSSACGSIRKARVPNTPRTRSQKRAARGDQGMTRQPLPLFLFWARTHPPGPGSPSLPRVAVAGRRRTQPSGPPRTRAAGRDFPVPPCPGRSEVRRPRGWGISGPTDPWPCRLPRRPRTLTPAPLSPEGPEDR